MSAHLEYTQGIIRIYDGKVDTAARPPEGFYSVLTITRTGPYDVLIVGDLSAKPLTRKVVKEIHALLAKEGFKRAYGWRLNGRLVPFGRNGRLVKTEGEYSLWEVDLA